MPELHGIPSVSIGLPVFNGTRTIKTAISAVRSQSFNDFELIVSDNGSTDGTLEICEAAAQDDHRVRVIRQDSNQGPVANFEAVLAAARSPYFVFLAADDWMEPGFIEQSLRVLEGDHSAVACAPRTQIHFADGRVKEAWGTRTIRGPAWLRPALYLLRPGDNSRFYGLYRTEVLRSCFPAGKPIYALDWVIAALTLQRGAHIQSKSVLLHREGAEHDKYSLQHLGATPGFLAKYLPLAEMSLDLLRGLRPGSRILAVPALLLLNLRQSAEIMLAGIRARFRKSAR